MLWGHNNHRDKTSLGPTYYRKNMEFLEGIQDFFFELFHKFLYDLSIYTVKQNQFK